MNNKTLEITRTSDGAAARNENVIFDTQLLNPTGITYDKETGVITFNEIGEYVIHWWVSTETILRGAVKYALVSSLGNITAGNSPAKTGQVSGFSTIDVTAPGTTLALVNMTDYIIAYSRTVPTKASLLITPIENKPATSQMFLPFRNTIVDEFTDEQGIPAKVTSLAFGVTISLGHTSINSDGTITFLPTTSPGFIIPYNAVIKSIYMTAVLTGVSSTAAEGILFPFIQLYSAPLESNIFTPIPESITMIDDGLLIPDPSLTFPYPMVYATNTNLDIHLNAGQLIIGAQLKIENPSGLFSSVFTYAGAVGISAL